MQQSTVITALTCVEHEKIYRNLAQSDQLYLVQMQEAQPEKQSNCLWDTILNFTNFRLMFFALQALRGSPPWSGKDSSMLTNALSSILIAPSKPSLGLQRDHVLDNCPQKLCVKMFHSQRLARLIDTKQHTPIKLIGLSLGKAVKIKGINKMIIPFECLLNY
jgi:hypothetical protein